MVGQPLVSVIALCYNHAQFLEEALSSIAQQTYSAIEVILVDDASTDASVNLAKRYLEKNPFTYPIKTLFLSENAGNCTAFNRGLALASGKYIIDFATDDSMLPQRIEQQVAYFESLSNDYGVVFTEAEYVDEGGRHLWYHYQDRLKHVRPIPVGDVYADVLAQYFISAPTMMIRKQVLDELGGYDEQLAYEDFDFWVRSARTWKYAYLDICTTQVRKHVDSMSAQQYHPGDPKLHSTYLVCRKALKMTETTQECRSLLMRILFELKPAIFKKHWKTAYLFSILLFNTIQNMITKPKTLSTH
ncbi:glycosyltransferase family 2 protein [Tunicatimonas pelagia]|uniref:glycosyltransferase family 2 protein n=1 Tax=Tunicatimonas pelagia TaxID=931531 RepID=UPI002666F2CC|nr:glycosyltransferase [Tunicatimonas pelagia]WKN41474.1 glycosyltransferase [Tunicatimonas pelagia]